MKRIGVGYASIFYGTGYGNGFPDESRATAQLNEDGTFTIFVEVSDVGSGGISVMWQIATETLGVEQDLVKIKYNDTTLMHDSGTAAASRQTYNTGNAVLNACQNLLDSMRLAVHEENQDYRFVYQEMLKKNIRPKAEGYFKASTKQVDLQTGQGDPYWPYTFGVQKVTVEVDDETGKVDIIDIVASYDAGKIVNPELAEGQVIGGSSMGIGYAIMEEVIVEKGNIKNRNFSDYIIPTSQDMPPIKTIFVEDIEETGPYGAKGLGEPVMIPTAPAIINAIYDAVGVRMTELPVTCDKLLLAIQNKAINGE